MAYIDASVKGYQDNIERILCEFDLSEKAIYLPPKNLSDLNSSLVFIPKKTLSPLTILEETKGKLISKDKEGVFLTPPGLFLSQLLEKEFGGSFLKINLTDIKKILPKILVRNLRLANDVEIYFENEAMTVKLTKSIFNFTKIEANNTNSSHAKIGSVLASALACTLAKVSGNPILIQDEIFNPGTNITIIKFIINNRTLMNL